MREVDVEPEETVKLVDGDHPKVFEAEQDLIIFEDVEPAATPYHPQQATTTPQTPSPAQQQSSVASPTPDAGPPHVDLTQKLPKTPRRRSAPSLHRAVLIRSAQRAAMTREMQVQKMEGIVFTADDEGDEEEEKEVEEVEEAVSAILEEEEEMEMDYEVEDHEDDEEVHDDIDDEQEPAEDEVGQDVTEVHNTASLVRPWRLEFPVNTHCSFRLTRRPHQRMKLLRTSLNKLRRRLCVPRVHSLVLS